MSLLAQKSNRSLLKYKTNGKLVCHQVYELTDSFPLLTAYSTYFTMEQITKLLQEFNFSELIVLTLEMSCI